MEKRMLSTKELALIWVLRRRPLKIKGPDDDFRRLLSELRDYLKPLALVAYLTGMRRGELLGLRWDQVNVFQGVINLTEDHTKTGEPKQIFFSSVPELKNVFVQAARDRKPGQDLVFTKPDGQPNVTPSFRAAFTINFGDNPPFSDHSKSLYDYISYAAVYEGCANEIADPSAPLNLTEVAFGIQFYDNRCLSLREKGLLTANTIADLAAEARQKLLEFGFLEEQLILDPSYWFLSLDPAVTVGYMNAYSRARVQDALCGYSYGATSPAGLPQPISGSVEAVLFGTSSGIPPTAGVNVINNNSVGGPLLDRISVSPSTLRQDENLDGLLCARSLFAGYDVTNGEKLRGSLQGYHKRLIRGIDEVLSSGKLNGKAGIIIAGRNDALVAPNHAARAYYGFNQFREGQSSNLRYYEVTNAHHLDALNALAGFDNLFIPLHQYFTQALDLMLANLREREPLPPSQVVTTIPRGGLPGTAPPIGIGNVPNIKPSPGSEALIVYNDDKLIVPE